MAQGEEKATTSREGRRGREARRAQRLQARATSVPWIQRRVPTTEILSPEAIATIEANAERLLEEVGIEFRDYPIASALSFMLMAIILVLVFTYIRRAGTEDLV